MITSCNKSLNDCIIFFQTMSSHPHLVDRNHSHQRSKSAGSVAVMKAAQRRQKLRSKWSKNDQQKEIETWVRSDSGIQDTSRHSGQLPDNVTEQRMLMNKLYDLSKERYKFLSQSSFDKKVFLERQQKKSRVLREMLVGVSTEGQRKSWSAEAFQRQSSSAEHTARHELDGLKRPLSNEEKRCKFPGECSHDHSRDESKPFSDMMKTVEIFKTESHGLLPTITLAPASPPPPVGNEESRLKVPSVKQSSQKESSSKRNVHFSIADVVKKEDDFPFENLSSWAKKGIRRKKGPKGPLADSRFQDLSRHLSDIHCFDSIPSDVHIIINHNESLHVPSKRPKHPGGAQGKMTAQIREFILSCDWLR